MGAAIQFLGSHFALALVLLNLATLFLIAHMIPPPRPSPRKVYLLLAHPDDQAMFFYPTLSALATYSIVLVVLTHSAKDDPRRAEMERSASRLGVQLVFPELGLLDSQEAVWDTERIEEALTPLLKDAGAIFTFDGYGVSGHPNHIALSKLFAKKIVTQKSETTAKLYHLLSTRLVRKYIGPMDMALSLLEGEFMFVNLRPWRVWQLMQCHESQLVWYRRLYLAFSRYLYFNTYRAPQLVQL